MFIEYHCAEKCVMWSDNANQKVDYTHRLVIEENIKIPFFVDQSENLKTGYEEEKEWVRKLQ